MKIENILVKIYVIVFCVVDFNNYNYFNVSLFCIAK